MWGNLSIKMESFLGERGERRRGDIVGRSDCPPNGGSFSI